MRVLVLGALLALTMGALAAADEVQVMIVGTFHMSNPGRDLHNVHVDDVLQPKMQADIAAAVDGLARFRPTAVDVEWDPGTPEPRYASYLKGTLEPSRNEVVQLGFRLAKEAGLATVTGIDVDGEFPYDAVQTYAKTHDETSILDAQSSAVETMVQTQTAMIRDRGVTAALRWLNDPQEVAHGNDFYRTTLRIGGGTAQPGADLLTAWYRRNFRICANLIQHARPGDRIVVFYGAGHAFLLRQCVSEMPGYRLVEADDYLPK